MALIELRDIHFDYGDGLPVFGGLDFSLERGDRIGLLGNNGSGKTTMLHLIVGLLRPQRGAVFAFGRERSSEEDFFEVRVKAGLLFQDADDQLFCPTVLEDVAFGPLNLGMSHAEARSMAEATLDGLGLSGYGGRITHHLSGGEKRLVSLATVMAMEPEVLLLDEPTANLDEQTHEKLINILRNLPQSMIIISHECGFLRAVTTKAVRLNASTLSEVDL